MINLKAKYILYGGMMSRGGADNLAFFAACMDDDTVLWVGLARPAGAKRDEIFARDIGYLRSASNK